MVSGGERGAETAHSREAQNAALPDGNSTTIQAADHGTKVYPPGILEIRTYAMDIAARSNLIVAAIDELMHFESGISATLRAMGCASANEPVTELIARLVTTAERHRVALEGRRIALTGTAPADVDPPLCETSSASGSSALQRTFELLSGAVIRYAALHPVTNRFRDSPISAPQGTTSHLVRDHIQEYLAAMALVAGSIQQEVLAELADADLPCGCTCPSCGIGMCVCGIGARAVLNEAWLAARPEPATGSVVLNHPRKTSAAAAAGLRYGDVVEAVDGAPLLSFVQLQTTIKSHEIGDFVRLAVRRGNQSVDLAIARAPDIGDGTLPLDCEVPSGQAFYLDRARDLQQRLRHRNGKAKANGAVGVTALSPRETQVLRLLGDGATNPMIAEKLGIRRPTVARHVTSILVKLNATNRAEAAAIAASNGFANEP